MISVFLCLRVQVFTLLLGGVWSLNLQAQLHNGLIYQQLLTEYLSNHPGPYQQVDGQLLAEYAPTILVDSTANTRLSIGFAEIQYRALDSGLVQRYFELSVQTEDSVMRSETLTHRDTLMQKSLQHIFRQSPKTLRGENPTRRARWGMPIAFIAGSVGGIITLFYFRSR